MNLWFFWLVAVLGCSSNDKVSCPGQIPIGARGACNYPETDVNGKYEYVCSYKLPCGEKTTCTCVPDGARWFCNVDCPAGPQACELNADGYLCPACASYPSPSKCVGTASTPFR
jgi:hypothetical protein